MTRNTYEREMFDRAGLKLGLDKAVLQSMNTDQGKNKSDGPGPWIQDTFSIYRISLNNVLPYIMSSLE